MALDEQGYAENPQRAELVVVGMDTALTYENLTVLLAWRWMSSSVS